jgi:hypothetical protein
MSRRLKAGLALGAIAAAIPVATVLGRNAASDAGPGQVGRQVAGAEHARVHRVDAPSAGSAKAVAKGNGLKLAYFETPKKTVKPGQTSILVGPVPKRCLVLNGYYFINGKDTTNVLSMGDSPAGRKRLALREWAFYRDNETGKAVKNVKYGVVCLRGTGIISG